MENKKHKATPVVPFYLSWLFPYKKKGIALNSDSPLKYYVFQNKISLIIINWLFQGMRSMGKADLIGKVLLDLILSMIFYIAISYLFKSRSIFQIVIAFSLAHTLNWLLNSHFWDVGRFIGITRTNTEKFFPYIKKVKERTAGRDSISSIIVIGGIARNAGFRETSDVDMIFIRKRGLYNAVKAALLTIRERIIAFFLRFPLHLELYENIRSVKHREDEVPILLKDIDEAIKLYYSCHGKQIMYLDDIEYLK